MACDNLISDIHLWQLWLHYIDSRKLLRSIYVKPLCGRQESPPPCYFSETEKLRNPYLGRSSCKSLTKMVKVSGKMHSYQYYTIHCITGVITVNNCCGSVVQRKRTISEYVYGLPLS